VTCVVAASKEDAPGVCRVVHLHVDVAEALWLGTLQKSRNADCPELPVTSVLTMCFGQALADSARPAGESGGSGGSGGSVDSMQSLRHLQWYSPSCKVPLATEDGHEVSRHVVFEMELSAKSVYGQRELAQKTFLMDGVAGAHYTVKMFLAGSVQFQPHAGLACENLEQLLSWQLRPGLGAEAGSALQTTRKRQFVQADTTDNELLAEPGGAPAAKSVRFDSLVAVRVDSVVSDSAESI
jgi:hypothetical protein